jgi:hypothetical protein
MSTGNKNKSIFVASKNKMEKAYKKVKKYNIKIYYFYLFSVNIFLWS